MFVDLLLIIYLALSDISIYIYWSYTIRVHNNRYDIYTCVAETSQNTQTHTHVQQQNDESAADWRKTIQDSLAEFNAIKLNSPSDSTPFYISLSLAVWRCYYHNPDHFCFFCCCWIFFLVRLKLWLSFARTMYLY